MIAESLRVRTCRRATPAGVLSLLKQHPSKNAVIGKRRDCGWNDDFLMEVLAITTT